MIGMIYFSKLFDTLIANNVFCKVDSLLYVWSYLVVSLPTCDFSDSKDEDGLIILKPNILNNFNVSKSYNEILNYNEKF